MVGYHAPVGEWAQRIDDNGLIQNLTGKTKEKHKKAACTNARQRGAGRQAPETRQASRQVLFEHAQTAGVDRPYFRNCFVYPPGEVSKLKC